MGVVGAIVPVGGMGAHIQKVGANNNIITPSTFFNPLKMCRAILACSKDPIKSEASVEGHAEK